MVVVLGAMDAEVSAVVGAMNGGTEHAFGKYRFYTGALGGSEIVVGKSGVGKARSAMVMQHLIDLFQPSSCIFTGLAGSLRPGIEIGDTLIARDCLQHDLDATFLGFARGEIPYENVTVFRCDRSLVERAATLVPESGAVHVGRVLTGDQFLAGSALSKRGYLRDELLGDAVEMEGASVGSVCTFNGVPFCLIRTISDRADTNARVDFERFLPIASLNSLSFVRHLLS